tara:strand:+ start:275 stop:2143 length:1869 start_codon:yes stop_codon:yes gene_type:complete
VLDELLGGKTLRKTEGGAGSSSADGDGDLMSQVLKQGKKLKSAKDRPSPKKEESGVTSQLQEQLEKRRAAAAAAEAADAAAKATALQSMSEEEKKTLADEERLTQEKEKKKDVEWNGATDSGKIAVLPQNGVKDAGVDPNFEELQRKLQEFRAATQFSNVSEKEEDRLIVVHLADMNKYLKYNAQLQTKRRELKSKYELPFEKGKSNVEELKARFLTLKDTEIPLAKKAVSNAQKQREDYEAGLSTEKDGVKNLKTDLPQQIVDGVYERLKAAQDSFDAAKSAEKDFVAKYEGLVEEAKALDPAYADEKKVDNPVAGFERKKRRSDVKQVVVDEVTPEDKSGTWGKAIEDREALKTALETAQDDLKAWIKANEQKDPNDPLARPEWMNEVRVRKYNAKIEAQTVQSPEELAKQTREELARARQRAKDRKEEDAKLKQMRKGMEDSESEEDTDSAWSGGKLRKLYFPPLNKTSRHGVGASTGAMLSVSEATDVDAWAFANEMTLSVHSLLYTMGTRIAEGRDMYLSTKYNKKITVCTDAMYKWISAKDVKAFAMAIAAVPLNDSLTDIELDVDSFGPGPTELFMVSRCESALDLLKLCMKVHFLHDGTNEFRVPFESLSDLVR